LKWWWHVTTTSKVVITVGRYADGHTKSFLYFWAVILRPVQLTLTLFISLTVIHNYWCSSSFQAVWKVFSFIGVSEVSTVLQTEWTSEPTRPTELYEYSSNVACATREAHWSNSDTEGHCCTAKRSAEEKASDMLYCFKHRVGIS
jgi:hypothetical protein